MANQSVNFDGISFEVDDDCCEDEVADLANGKKVRPHVSKNSLFLFHTMKPSQ